MTIPVEQIPLWAWILIAMFAIGAAKYIYDRNKDDWKETRGVLKEMASAVTELVKIQTLHTHQINENSSDIKEIQSKLSGNPNVKY